MKTRRSLLLLLTLVLVVGGAGSLWVWQAKRQYTLNRKLIAALVKNDTKAALALVNAGADPNTRLDSPPVPTLPELVRRFLHHKPPPANNSPTAFLLACGVEWDLSSGLDIEQVKVEEDLPLLQAMLLHGAYVNATTSKQDTALLGAVSYRDTATVVLLLEHGAKINAANANNETALMYAALKNDMEKVGVLLAHGAQVNAQDKWGSTALYWAVIRSINKDIIRQLLAHGADPNLPDKAGETPLMIAQKMKRPDFVELLRRKR